MNFWKELRKPLFVQAPMEDVTDTVFRQMLLKTGRPDVFFTEFTNVDGMFSAGRELVMQRLQFGKEETPIVAQIWGSKPENFYNAAKYIKEQGFDGVDLNMGCPQKDVIKKGLCAALIENRDLAAKIIKATQDGADGLPVSVKTRIGIKEISTEDWIGFLLGFDLAALIIHGRTVKEMSAVPAHWDEIGKAVELRARSFKDTVLIGNGDVMSREDGIEKIKTHGVDGVMIGRGILENPWVFNVEEKVRAKEERVATYAEHVRLHSETWGATKHFDRLKKYMKMYIRGFAGSSELRAQIVECSDTETLLSLLEKGTVL
ncbi:MAG: putative tRNA-dihydrouridine synthase [Microgenomates bacterium OLB23]|nr:MAG: putative tRNA-dihydrouridine synthase [Microgenomates bacterium OLB23]